MITTQNVIRNKKELDWTELFASYGNENKNESLSYSTHNPKYDRWNYFSDGL